MQITVLCKVVDNFGDIGVVYRLSKQLKKLHPENIINLVVDDLVSFNRICSAVKCDLVFQEVEGLCIYNWKTADYCHEVFSRDDGEKMPVILECFQCGRPDWMEKILFEEKLNRTVHIIMIDYLTAEPYAENFHCLQSLTRSAKVQKVNFMPGFTEKTGGLVIEDEWREVPERNADGPVLVFTYERDWVELVRGLVNGGFDKPFDSAQGPLNHRRVLVAQGRGKESLMSAVKACDADNYVEELPYLNQPKWDKIMKSCSALVIRGEESMSRACLSGIPFLWHAYPQSDEYQLVKVKALLERMRRHFNKDDFEIVERAWLDINSPSEPSLRGAERRSNPYSAFFSAVDRLTPGFYDFALSLRKNGDLAANLMTYIEKLAII